MNTKTLTERDLRILDAALSLFVQNGLRGTTMEAIARKAGIAKPTLYARHKDKEDVLRAVFEHLIVKFKTIVSQALDSDASLETRLSCALIEKSKAVSDLLSGSPHAQDLITDRTRYAGAQFAALHDWMVEQFTECLTRHGHPRAQECASLLIGCADGLHAQNMGIESYSKQIVFLCQRLIPV